MTREKRKYWTMEEDSWLSTNYLNYTNEEMADMWRDMFGHNRTAIAIRTRYNDKLGLKRARAGGEKKLTPEVVEWLVKNIKNYTHRELAGELEKELGIKVHTGTIGKWLKKYTIRTPDYFTKLGDTVSGGREGRELIKVSDIYSGKDYHKNFIEKRRYMYEKYHNEKLTENDFIIFLNNDESDYSKENLYKITKGVSLAMNARGWRTDNSDITKAGILICQLVQGLKNN